MSEPIENRRPPLGLGNWFILFLAGVAFAAMVVPWCIRHVGAHRGVGWREGSAAMLVSLAVFSALFLWVVKARSPGLVRGLVGGLLLGLAIIVNAGAALALFDYAISGDVAVALRILPVVVMLSSVAAAVGCACGCVVGIVVSALEHRAAKASARKGDPQAIAPKRRRGRLLVRLATGTLVAAVVLALYSPVSEELVRRRAVLAIRAAGGQVSFDPRRRVRISELVGRAGEFLSWLDAPQGSIDSEAWFYSLEAVQEVGLAAGAADEQLGYVFDLPEVAFLDLRNTSVTAAGLKRVTSELMPGYVRLHGTPLTDEGLGYLAAAPLAGLDLSDQPITDDSLWQLAGAMSLRGLNLSRTNITDEGLSHLAGLNLLVALELRGTRVTDEGLRHVSNMASLRSLDLSETAITSSGLKHLKAVRGLIRLDLSKTQLHGPGLGQLKGLAALSHLNLEGTRFDEAAFQELGTLGQVKALNLNGSNVNDAWLRHLSAMKNPYLEVWLQATDVSEEGLQSLQQSLPGGHVGRQPPPGAARGR